MTEEEAIKIIKECREKRFERTLYTLDEYQEALDMAIKALEQEPCTNIPYLMHREMDIPISECQKAYDVAIEYLRSQAKVRG